MLPQEPAQFCKLQGSPFFLQVVSVLASMEHHQTPTPSSMGNGKLPSSSTPTSPSHYNLSPNTIPGCSRPGSEDEFYADDGFQQRGSSSEHFDSSGSSFSLTHNILRNSPKCPDTPYSRTTSMCDGTSNAYLVP